MHLFVDISSHGFGHLAITAPVLSVVADHDSLAQWWKERFTLQEFHERISHVRQLTSATVKDAGHMLHHDQPQAVAGLIEDFLG